MTPKQIKYGKSKLAEYSKDLNLPQRKIVDILQNLHFMMMFFEWVNADDFLIAVENNEFQLEDE
jgi:hypothetical protein